MASGRNDPCPCGSGRKYKSCCLRGDEERDRQRLHETTLAGAAAGWPAFMDPDTWLLRYELQRRWLLWYDEAVRKGITDPAALRQVLVGRQREWENTPHPGVAGRTPAEVVRAFDPSGLE